ncbi:putative efflux protein, MATE family [Anaerocolumna jejuensis DSM 15929]|uniref:Probable multidrug resistance protein NorM n=1 Tax=Anaerocolumna jejuensis DSM 15929 TaxID=1121322 RepID=A0A1M6TCQ4_9FIRM|nr:MATE family efflux transporter [Anaerocolumna jejuensis]SHK54751.1 putative efflux protein, MATE family [Anaerocolumna jejuensis DSM 15929]
MPNDLTSGKPMKLIIGFTVPILIGNIVQQFYYVIDSIIVGQYLGMNALAAVGSTGSLTFLVIGWIMGITGGFAILIAQRYGAEDIKGVRHYVAMSFYLCAVMAVIMTVSLMFTNRWVLTAMNTPKEIFHDTYSFIAVIYIGLTATIAYNILAAVLRALGDSKTPLYFLLLSSILNIILDYLFIAGFSMGVKGAGYATVISQAFASVLCLIYMIKKYPILRLKKEDTYFSWKSAGKLMGMGTPMGLQFSITAIGTMIVQIALNRLGPVYIAAFAAAGKIQNIITQPLPSLGASLATYVGQNTGAGKMDRVKAGVRSTIILSVICGILSMVAVLVFGDALVKLFVTDNVELVVSKAKIYFYAVAGFYIPLGLIFVYRNTLQGLGDGLLPMLGGIFELFARGIVIVLLAKPLGFVGICLASPVAWVSALIPIIPAYYYRMKKLGNTI